MIRFYMNGTAGKQDGTEISNGDLSNPLVADGFYPAAGVTVTKTVNVMIRADAGETWKHVFVQIMSTSTDERSKYSVSCNNIVNFYHSSASSIPFFPTITETNQLLTLSIKASGDESNSPDTTQKLIAFGGKQV